MEILSLCDGGDEPQQLLFRSNAIDRSCNPSYLSMSLQAAVPLFQGEALKGARVMLRFIHGGDAEEDSNSSSSSSSCRNDNNKCLHQALLDLSKFVCLGQLQLHSISSLPLNTIILSTDDGFYGTESLAQTLLALNVIPSMTRRDPSAIAPSSSSMDSGDGEADPVSIVDKIGSTLEDVRPSQERALLAISGIREEDKRSIGSLVNRSRLEQLLRTVEGAEADASKEEDLRAMEQCLFDNSDSVRQSVAVCEQLSQSVAALGQQWQVRRDELGRNQFFFEARKIKLLSELQGIYPIELCESGEYSIRGIELPMDLGQRDDEQISSALGYLVHLLLLASKYLAVPLRYQLLFFASRSMIRGPIQSSGAALPLYKRGTERERFDRALVWLQRDVLQLLQSRKIPYNNRMSMLCNVGHLFACEMCPSLC